MMNIESLVSDNQISATAILGSGFASCHTAGPISVMHKTVLVFRDKCPILPTCTLSTCPGMRERAKREV